MCIRDRYPYLSRRLLTDSFPADTGENTYWLNWFDHWAHEDPNNNLAQTPIQITYREPDLQVTELVLPAGATSGQVVPITYTVTNTGTRDTRETAWPDRFFLSRDPSLDSFDYFLGESSHGRVLKAGESYTNTLTVRLPDSIDGDFYILAYTDSAALRDSTKKANFGTDLPGVRFLVPSPLAPFDFVSRLSRELARGAVYEFQGEGNNILPRLLPVTLATPPDLQVTAVDAPGRVNPGQALALTYTVTNRGGAVPPTTPEWFDLVYFSRDPVLDVMADRYLGFVRRTGVLGAGESYTVTTTVRVPADLIGPYYLFVVTDPAIDTPIGKVFEGPNERNNATPTAAPVVIELPPPSDLVVQSVAVPPTARAGDPVQIQWTVRNASDQPATGVWSDAAYLSADGVFDIGDRPLGRVQYSGTLAPGETYTLTLNATLPPVTPGRYRVIVRTDIFNQVYEGPAGEGNNVTPSADTLQATVQALTLGTPLATTLSTGQTRLLQVTVPLDATLKVTLTSPAAGAANELFLRFDQAPTGSTFDAAYKGGLASTTSCPVASPSRPTTRQSRCWRSSCRWPSPTCGPTRAVTPSSSRSPSRARGSPKTRWSSSSGPGSPSSRPGRIRSWTAPRFSPRST
jgi:hypothetical protein